MNKRINALKKAKQEFENKIQKFSYLNKNIQYGNIADFNEAKSLLSYRNVNAQQKFELYKFIILFYNSKQNSNCEIQDSINILTEFAQFCIANYLSEIDETFHDYNLLYLVEIMLNQRDYKLSDIDLAKNCLAKIKDKKGSMYLRNKGLFLQTINQYEEALKYYKLSIASNKGIDSKTTPYHHMTYICIRLAHYDQAKQYLAKAREHLPESYIQFYLYEADIFISEYQLDQAIIILDKIPINCQNAKYYFMRGEICQILNNHDNAIEYFLKSISIKNNIFIKYHLALSYYKNKDLENFHKLFNEILEDDNLCNKNLLLQQIISIKISLHYIAGDHNTATKIMDSLFNNTNILSLNDINSLILIAKILYDMKKYDDGVVFITSLLKNLPDNAPLQYWLGKSYIKINQLHLAHSFISQSFNLNQYQIDIRIDLGNLLILEGKYQEAIKLYEEERLIFNIQKNNIRILNNIAKAYYELNEFEQSLQYITQAIIYNQNNAHLYIHKALILIKQNEIKQAIEAFEHAVNIDSKLFNIVNKNLKKLSEFNSTKLVKVNCSIIETNDVNNEQNEIIANQEEAARIIANAKKMNEFKIYKTLTETEKARKKFKEDQLLTNSELLKDKKIWGEANPVFNSEEITPLIWGNITKEQTKYFAYLPNDIKEQLEANTLKSALELLAEGRFTNRDKNQQGIKFYNKNCIKIKMLGFDGDIRIVGRKIKDQNTNFSLFIFDKIEKKHMHNFFSK